jgi:DNA-binding transcriptional ArsR family regulator
MEAALKAIVEPRRREILRLVREDELTAGEIASRFEVSWPAISQHLAVLKEAGLVSERRNGTRRYYRTRAEGLEGVKAFLDEFWDDRLQALKREAEREERGKHGKRDENDVAGAGNRDRCESGDSLGVSRRSRQADPLDGPTRERRSASRGRLPDRGHPRSYGER